MIELEYRGQKIHAIQVWAAAVPQLGTLILGETEQQARETLRRFGSGEETEELSQIEIELRLIMANPNRTERLQLIHDWVRLRVHEYTKRDKAG